MFGTVSVVVAIIYLVLFPYVISPPVLHVGDSTYNLPIFSDPRYPLPIKQVPLMLLSLVENEKPIVAVAAGDISCPGCHMADTAALIPSVGPDVIFTAGDNNNGDGSLSQYLAYFEPTWGQYKSLIHPAMGNHDEAHKAVGYLAYFGTAAGDPKKGYYSFDLPAGM